MPGTCKAESSGLVYAFWNHGEDDLANHRPPVLGLRIEDRGFIFLGGFRGIYDGRAIINGLMC